MQGKEVGGGMVLRTSWMISCAHRSYPHRPTRLSTVPATRPDAATRGTGSAQKNPTPTPSHSICQPRKPMPARAGPSDRMARGAIQVADSSKMTERVRTRAMCGEV